MQKWSFLLLVIMSSLFLNTQNYAGSCDLSGFVTYTQGGWGSPSNSTPGTIRDTYFHQVFPSGMTIGGIYSATFTSAAAVQAFLPQGGTSGVFNKNYSNPTSTSAGVFGGQLAALYLNVMYSQAGVLGNNALTLGQLKIVSGPLAGLTVNQLLSYANIAIGGGSTPFSLTDLETAADKINNNFDNGTKDQKFLTCPDPVLLGKIGDKVWIDANKNGIQDAGEAGVANVTVKLYTCDNNLLGNAVTDASGNYLFQNIPAGNYYVKFELPAGYVFTAALQGTDKAKDSDADITSGKSDCITLAAGENNLTLDAGIYVFETPTSPKPEPKIEKTDGIIFMKPVGENDTYTITYSNIGEGDLLNAAIIDTLPEGLQYVSCAGAISCSEVKDNIVRFELGTLAAGQSGTVTVTASVTTVLDNYTNWAYIEGYDKDGNYYWNNASDVDITDTTSSGGDGGVESRGDMAELLFQRQLKIKYGMTTPMLSKTKMTAGLASVSTLKELVPEVGPFDSRAAEVTPFDILGISNALSAYAVNYKVPVKNSSKTVAVVFSTITSAPYIYDHTKSVCDRLAGSEIKQVKLVRINGREFYAAKLYNPATKVTDYAVSFSVYETPDGYKVENKWTYSEYSSPANATLVYNFQVWSAAYKPTTDLVEDILSRFNSYGSVEYLNSKQNTPDVYVDKVSYKHTGKIVVAVNNTSEESKDVNFNILYRTSQNADQLSTDKSYTVQAGESTVEIDLGVIADANIKMTQNSGFMDEAYVSGGSYASVNGPQSTVNQFTTNTYSQVSLSEYPDGSVVLAGGASMSGTLKDFVSVMRSLTTNGSAYDLSANRKLRFEADGTGTLSVLLDLTTTEGYNYHACNVELTGSSKVYELDLSSFKTLWGNNVALDPSKVRMVAFRLAKENNPDLTTYNVEVKNIAFLKTGESTSTEVPTEFALTQNYPNPFNPSTVIEFTTAQKGQMNLTIYNILGQKIRTLVNGELEAGKHSVSFDAKNLPSGVYIYKLSGENVNLSRKMLLTK